MWISILYACIKCVRGAGNGVLGLRQRNTCRKVPLQVNFLRWRHFALPSTSLIFLRPDSSITWQISPVKNRRSYTKLSRDIRLSLHWFDALEEDYKRGTPIDILYTDLAPPPPPPSYPPTANKAIMTSWCQHETVRKETILMYLNTPDFFIPYFSFWTFFSILIFMILGQNDPDVTVRKWNISKFQRSEF